MGNQLRSTWVWVGVCAGATLACALVVTCLAVLADRPGPAPPGPATPAATTAARVSAREGVDPRGVLRDWDARRAAAWVAEDVDGLAALYTRGSVAGRRDVRLLRRWTSRAARVTRLEPQVLALTAVQVEPDRLVVRVTDRVAVLRAEVRGRAVPLPRDQVSTRLVVLRRTGAWRVAAVLDVATPPALADLSRARWRAAPRRRRRGRCSRWPRAPRAAR